MVVGIETLQACLDGRSEFRCATLLFFPLNVRLWRRSLESQTMIAIYDHQPSNVSLEDTQSISSVEYDDWAAKRQWWRYMTIMAGSCLWYRHRNWHCWYWWLCYGFNWDTCTVEGKHVSTATKPPNAKSNRQCGLPAERYWKILSQLGVSKCFQSIQ